jgi:KipI family sensor histidine kinase inhibitor
MNDWPRIRTVGLSGVLVSFGSSMSEAANRAALAFRAAVDQCDWSEVSETSTSLVPTFLSADLATCRVEALAERVRDLLGSRDWFSAPLPENRALWHIPTVYGGSPAPQLEEAAEAAKVDPDEAIAQLSSARLRVLTIGFAPGQPYMGELPEHWNIPRQQGLTKKVPQGALVVAIRQLIVFTNDSPTGWRHVGQTAFRNFRPEERDHFSFAPGDEVMFPSVSQSELERIRSSENSGNGGAEREIIA